MKKLPICVMLLTISFYGENLAQSRESTFQMLNIPANAPLMAMGGYNITWSGADPSQFFSNAALSADSLHGYAGFNYISFSGAYTMATASYQHTVGKGNLNSGIRHLSFGDIQGYDAAGNQTEKFSSGQTAVTVGYQLSVNNFSYGINLDFVNVGIAGFNSNAVAFSLGGLFIHPERDLTIGATIKNVGFVVSEFIEGSSSDLPLDVQLGASFKPQHMPLRFSLTGHHLFNGDLLDESIDSSTTRELLAHLVAGMEIILSKNISLLAGYNHLIRQELKLQETAGSAGFSYGFFWRTKNLQFAYGRGAYHAGGASHVLSVNINLNKVFRKI